MCAPCYDKALKAENPQYRNRQLANTSRWLTEISPERRAELNAYRSARWRRQKTDPGHIRKRRNSSLTKKYGITADEYDLILENQGGGCKICTRKPGDRPHHVDHDHVTGIVRGTLCHQRNWFMGTIDADPTVLTRLNAYAPRKG